MRKGLFFGATIALAAALGVACAPEGPPQPSDQLPLAPAMAWPSSLADGTVAIVDHDGSGGPDDAFHVVDSGGARPLVSTDRELLLRALGRVSPTGSVLVSDQDRDEGSPLPLSLCKSYSSGDCRVVPIEGPASSYGFSPDGSLLAVVIGGAAGDDLLDRLEIRDTETFELVVSATTSTVGSTVRTVWSPDSDAVAITVRDGGGSIFDTSLATLAVAPGAVPQVVVPSTPARSVLLAVGWSDDDTLQFQWWDRTPASHLGTRIAAVPFDGTSTHVDLGPSHLMDLPVGLRDGSVLNTPWSAEGQVVHHLRSGSSPRPLSLPVRWTIGDDEAVSTTRILGIIEPG